MYKEDYKINKEDFEEENFSKTIERLKISKDPKEHLLLGDIYLEGLFIKYDVLESLKEYLQANELDDTLGFGRIGTHYYKYAKQEENALEFWKKGIEKNDLDSKLKLANYYLNNKIEFDKAYELLEDLVEEKYLPGIYHYGLELIKFFEGRPIDRLRGYKLIKEAAEFGNKDAISYCICYDIDKKIMKKKIDITFFQNYFDMFIEKAGEDVNKREKAIQKGFKYFNGNSFSYYGDILSEKNDKVNALKYYKKGNNIHHF
jgi:TPR repeat protein